VVLAQLGQLDRPALRDPLVLPDQLAPRVPPEQTVLMVLMDLGAHLGQLARLGLPEQQEPQGQPERPAQPESRESPESPESPVRPEPRVQMASMASTARRGTLALRDRPALPESPALRVSRGSRA
jgi:hypothetical protein